jgi:hypothetical protein
VDAVNYSGSSTPAFDEILQQVPAGEIDKQNESAGNEF